VCGFPKEKLQKTVRFIYQNYSALPIDCDDYEHLYEIMKHDKKNQSATINFTLLADIGDIKINQTVDKDLVFQSLDFYRDSVGL
jgi:3-dehydroquinate synthase